MHIACLVVQLCFDHCFASGRRQPRLSLSWADVSDPEVNVSRMPVLLVARASPCQLEQRYLLAQPQQLHIFSGQYLNIARVACC